MGESLSGVCLPALVYLSVCLLQVAMIHPLHASMHACTHTHAALLHSASTHTMHNMHTHTHGQTTIHTHTHARTMHTRLAAVRLEEKLMQLRPVRREAPQITDAPPITVPSEQAFVTGLTWPRPRPSSHPSPTSASDNAWQHASEGRAERGTQTRVIAATRQGLAGTGGHALARPDRAAQEPRRRPHGGATILAGVPGRFRLAALGPG